MKTTQTYKICDNLIGMSGLQDNSIDLTVTSPPYDNLRTYNGYFFDFEKLAHGLYRVTKEGGVVVWIVGDSVINGSETNTSFKQALFFKDVGFNLHDTMIYWKNGFAFPESNRYAQNFEYMFVFSKDSPKTANIARVATNKTNRIKSKSSCYRTQNGDTTPMKYATGKKDRNRENIWIYEVGYQKSSKDIISFEHPATFPEQLAKDHILSWSNEGDTVLDPFLGSGTTLKMCMETNRNGIGFEINEGYETIIKERLKVDTIKLDAWTT